MLRTIYLYGKAREQTGIESLQLDVNTPYQLMRGLSSQVPGFRRSLIEYPAMAIVIGNKDKYECLTPEIAQFPLSEDASEIHLVTEVEGAGIEAGLIAAFSAMGASAAVAATLATISINMLVSFAVGAIASALAPSPSTTQGTAKADERPSFLYNGAVNVVEQGFPVPLVYGTHMVGSIVVSAGVEVSELPYESDKENPPANGGGSTQPSDPPVQDWQWESTGGM